MTAPQTDKYFHESGHIVMNRLFDEAFIFELITVDTAVSKQFHVLSNAGLKGKYAIPLEERTVFDHDKAVLSLLGGFCADELVLKSRKIDTNFFETSTWGSRIQEFKYAGDWDLICSTFYPYIKPIINLAIADYITLCLKSAFEIMNTDAVWNSVNLLRNKLIQKHTLYLPEVQAILKESGYDQWKAENKNRIIEERIKALTIIQK